MVTFFRILRLPFPQQLPHLFITIQRILLSPHYFLFFLHPLKTIKNKSQEIERRKKRKKEIKEKKRNKSMARREKEEDRGEINGEERERRSKIIVEG